MKVSLDTWIQMLGVLGVLGGFFVLIFELNQSQRLSRAAAVHARISEIQVAQRELAMSGDFADILQKFKSKGIGSLSPSEMTRVKAWHSSIQWRMEGQFYQYELGFLAEAALQRTLDEVAHEFYQEWEVLGLVDSIHPIAWRNRIDDRLNQSGEQ